MYIYIHVNNYKITSLKSILLPINHQTIHNFRNKIHFSNIPNNNMYIFLYL